MARHLRRDPLTCHSLRSHPLAQLRFAPLHCAPCGAPGLKCLDEPVAPPNDIFVADVIEHGLPAGRSFFAAHRERATNGVSEVIGTVRIYQERLMQLCRGSGEARQYQDSRVIWILRRHKFLGDQVHSVAQGGDQANARCAVHTGENCASEALVDVAYWNPV